MQTALTNDNQTLATKVLRRLRPDADVLESGEAFLLTLDLPGVAPDQLDVSLDAGVLGIVGTRFLEREQEGKARAAVEYRREFRLPDVVDAEGVEARLESGVLTLNLPKAQAARPRRIEIKS